MNTFCYPLIPAWRGNSGKDYISNLIKRAQKEDAPHDAIYLCKDKWVRLHECENVTAIRECLIYM